MIEIIPNWHPILVHFTTALLLVSAVLFLLSHILKHKSYVGMILNTAYVNLWVGFLITIMTVIIGFEAYRTVGHDVISHQAMKDHRNWALVTFAIFILLFVWSIINYRKKIHYNIWFAAILIIASGSLLVTAYKGGELVYKYGAGVTSLPQTQKHDHSRHHH